MIRGRTALTGGWCLAAALAVQAAPWQAELGAGAERLSGGRSGWRQTDGALRYAFAPRASAELNVRRTERFELRDSEIGAAIAAPIGGAWSGALAIASSPTHRTLPRGSVAGRLQRALGDGWAAGAGLKRTRYDEAATTGLSLAIERYFGNWRAAAEVLHTRVDSGGPSTDALRLQLDRYIGERSRVGLIVAGGREIDDLGVSTLTISQVETVALVGRWQVAPSWALVADIGSSRVGSLYRRSGGRLGVQLDF